MAKKNDVQTGVKKRNCEYVAVMIVNSYGELLHPRPVVSEKQMNDWNNRFKVSPTEYRRRYRNFAKMARVDLENRFGIEMQRFKDGDETKLEVIKFVDRLVAEQSEEEVEEVPVSVGELIEAGLIKKLPKKVCPDQYVLKVV